MREITTETEIRASAEHVWRILTDFGRFEAWNPFIRQAEGHVEEGARLKIRIEPPGGRAMTFRPTVTRAVPGRELRWLGRVVMPGLFDGEHIFEIEPLGETEPAGEGRVRFVQRERFRGLLVPLLWGRMEASTRQGFHAMNAALKERAEAG